MTERSRGKTKFDELVSIETDDCVLWPLGKTAGYGTFGKHTYVHQLACEIANGPRPDNSEAAHSCGVRACMNRRHLRWATRLENRHDMVAHGASPKGERNGRSVLIEDEVRQIRQLVDNGLTHRAVAARFNISTGTVSDITRRHSWAWLD